MRKEPAGASITIEFKNAQVSGHSACNAYGASYHATNSGSIGFGKLSVTAMSCEQPTMELESAYLNALEKVTGFSVDGKLELKGPGVTLTYTREVARSRAS